MRFPFFFGVLMNVRILQCNNVSLCKAAPVCVLLIFFCLQVCLWQQPSRLFLWLQTLGLQWADAHWAAQSTGQQQADYVPGLLSKEHKMLRLWNLVRFNTSKLLIWRRNFKLQLINFRSFLKCDDWDEFCSRFDFEFCSSCTYWPL